MNRKTWILAILLVAIIGAIIGLRMYFKPHTNISKAKAVYHFTAKQLIQEFSDDEAISTQKYMNKILDVRGTLVAQEKLHDGSEILLLEDELEGISCQLDSSWVANNLNVIDDCTIGGEVHIKGRCEGILMEIKINPAIIIHD